jgi:O-antigen ligase
LIHGPRTARLGWALASLMMAAALLLTFSKGSWLLLGLLAAMLTLARLPIGGTLTAVAMTGLAVGFVLFYLDPIWRTLLFLFPDSRQASINPRLELWWAALRVFLERPLLGFGPEGFAGATVAMREGPVASLTRAHNMYLQALVDYGIVGSVLLWSTFAVILRRAWLAVDRRRLPIESARHLGLLLGTAAFFLYGFVETLNVSNQYVNTHWLIIGLLAASTREAGLRRGERA